MTLRVKLLLTVLSIFFLNTSIEATTFYVAPSGGGGCSTNINSPQGGVNNGINCLNPGDTLILRNGVYDALINADDIPNGNSNTARTIIRAENPLGAELRPTGGVEGPILHFINGGKSNITFDGLIMDLRNLSPSYAIVFRNPTGTTISNITIQNGELRNGLGAFSASNAGGIAQGSAQNNNILILNMKIHDLGFDQSLGSTCNACSSYGIYFSGGGYTVDNAEMYNISGYAIHGFNSGGTSNNNTLRNSYIHDNGFALDNADAVLAACGGDNWRVYNNVITRQHGSNGFGIVLAGSCSGQAATNSLVANNTVFGNDGGCIGVSIPGAANNNRIYNNICWQNGNDTITFGGNGSNNDFQANHCGSAGSTGGCSTVGNPNFVNQNAGDFHITSSSSASTGGLNLSSDFTTDKDLNTRTTPWTRGAYAVGGTPPVCPCGGTFPNCIACPVLPAKIWLTFEEGSGSTVTDETKNGNTATLTGTTLPTFVPGRLGRFGLSINNLGDYATVNIGAVASPFTIAMSINSTDAIVGGSTTFPFFAEYSISGGEISFNWDISIVGNQQSFIIGSGGGVYTPCKYVSALSNGVFYRLLLTYDGSNMRCYLNGVLERTVASSPPAGTMINFWLSRPVALGWRGILDEFIVDNRVWTQAEITSDFNRNFNPSPIGPYHGGR